MTEDIYKVLEMTVPYLQSMHQECAWKMIGTSGGLAAQREYNANLYVKISELLQIIYEVFKNKPNTITEIDA